MHDLPDTERIDAAAERYWPEEFKRVLKTRLRERVEKAFRRARPFEEVIRRNYGKEFSGYNDFVIYAAEGVVIGAEKGVDDLLMAAHRSWLNHQPLPLIPLYADYLWPDPLDPELSEELYREAREEFSTHPLYRHLHQDHDHGPGDFETWMDDLGRRVVRGAKNGADQSLASIYRALLFQTPLPIFRRRPRRIR